MVPGRNTRLVGWNVSCRVVTAGRQLWMETMSTYKSSTPPHQHSTSIYLEDRFCVHCLFSSLLPFLFEEALWPLAWKIEINQLIWPLVSLVIFVLFMQLNKALLANFMFNCITFSYEVLIHIWKKENCLRSCAVNSCSFSNFYWQWNCS